MDRVEPHKHNMIIPCLHTASAVFQFEVIHRVFPLARDWNCRGEVWSALRRALQRLKKIPAPSECYCYKPL
jgi:hypothetical protein